MAVRYTNVWPAREPARPEDLMTGRARRPRWMVRIAPLGASLVLLVALGLLAAAPVLGRGPVAEPGVGDLLPVPTVKPSVERRPFAPPTVTFYGRGYGHGVGMSQYGARGRALAGQTAATILAHYYQGTTLATISASSPVRILVLAPFKATAAKPIVLHGRGAPFTIDGISGTFPIGAKVAVSPYSRTSDTTQHLLPPAIDRLLVERGYKARM